MATKSNRSSGTQPNARGVTQGVSIVGPRSGLPIDEVVDSDGRRRLAVDAAVTLDTAELDVKLEYDNDSVALGDPSSGNILGIESDGSLNVNVKLDSSDDSVAIKNEAGTELHINPDGSILTETKAPGIPVIANISIVNASQEYSYTFPANTKKFSLKARFNSKIQLAYQSGDSSTQYISISPGSTQIEKDINLAGVTAYFQTSKPNEVIEICSWN